MKGKVLLATLVFIAAIFTAPSPAEAATSYRKLNVPTPSQNKSNWCWAAASYGVMKYFHKKPTTQCAIVAGIRGGRCANVGGNYYDVKALLNRKQLDMSWYPGPLSLGFLKKQIDAGRPLMVSLEWARTGTGHLIIVDGYHNNYVYVDFITQSKTYQIKMKYTEFVKSSKNITYTASNGGKITIAPHHWRYTYYNLRRTK